MKRILLNIKAGLDGGYSKEVSLMQYAQSFQMRIGALSKSIMSLCSMNTKEEKAMERK